jgi:CubicO group peptidase (beta-lactamase class C family)
MAPVATQLVEGHVCRGFEPVRDAFEENFSRRGELGGACCAYYRGEKVVDLWGGVRNKATGDPWERDTMVVVHSATKGLAAMTLAVAHSRKWLDYDEPVAAYWPEFAQNGKQDVTVRQLLAHQAGLFAFDEPVDRAVIADPDRLAAVMARHKPAWKPGTRQAYGLRSETLDALAAAATPSAHGFFDECLKAEVQFSLGFMKPSATWRFGSSGRAFGAPGAGASLGFADPDIGHGYGYVTSHMGMTFTGDPRDVALRDALYSAL